METTGKSLRVKQDIVRNLTNVLNCTFRRRAEAAPGEVISDAIIAKNILKLIQESL